MLAVDATVPPPEGAVAICCEFGRAGRDTKPSVLAQPGARETHAVTAVSCRIRPANLVKHSIATALRPPARIAAGDLQQRIYPFPEIGSCSVSLFRLWLEIAKVQTRHVQVCTSVCPFAASRAALIRITQVWLLWQPI